MRIALYQPDIPQNSGNIFRLGACFGISIDIIEPTGYIFDDKRFRRSSMDYINHIDYKRHIDWENFINWSKKNNFRLILLTTKAEKKYCDYTYKDNDILLFGRESAGVPKKVHNLVSNRLKIPMKKDKRSLNLATSVGIVLAEQIRQIRN